MATKRRSTRRRGWSKAKRARAGRKAWRTRLRRYPKKRSSVGKRGYRNNPRKRRGKRRRNPLFRTRKGRFSRRGKKRLRKLRYPKGGWRNPRRGKRRRRNSMYSGRLYANPKRRRRGRSRRRHNPFAMGGTIGSIKSALMSPAKLTQFAAAAAGLTVSEFAASIIGSKIAGFLPAALQTGWGGALFGSALRIATAVLVGSFVPPKYRTAFVLGGGASAVKPFVDMALAPVLSATGMATPIEGMRGIAGWISTDQARGMAGMGSWITDAQMPRLGTTMSGFGDFTRQPGMQSAFTM